MPPVFDGRLVRLHRARAARRFETEAFLHRRVAEDLADRLEAVNRRFDRVLVLGAPEVMRAVLAERPHLASRIEMTIGADWSDALAGPRPSVVCEKEVTPFADEAFDLVLSNLALHHVDDLPGALVQLRRALKPDGLFIGALFGGETLHELRAALLTAEAEARGGAALRVGPFASLKDMADLLQRTGFALPVADNDVVSVRYKSVGALVRDLRAMGETSALVDRGPALTRSIITRAEALYAWEDDRKVAATFEILTVTGWRPHPSQPKALAPGSATMSLAEVFDKHGQSENAPY